MNANTLPYLLPYFVSLGITLMVAGYAWRHRQTTGARPFALAAFSEALWTLGYICELISPDLASKIFWDDVQFFAAAGWAVGFFAFGLEYTSRRRRYLRVTWAMHVVVITLYLLLLLTDRSHHLIRPNAQLIPGEPFSALVYPFTLPTWIVYVYFMGSFITSLIMIASHLSHTQRLYRTQTLIVIIGTAIPLVGVTLTIFDITLTFQRDTTPLTFALSNIILTWGLFRYRLFALVPIARSTVIENIRDAVWILDDQSQVVDLNPAAQVLLGRPLNATLGQPAAQVFEQWPQVLAYLSNPAQAEPEVTLGQGPEQHTVNLTVSPVRDQNGHPRGQVVVAHDITILKRSEEALRQHTEEKLQRSTEQLSTLNEIGRAVTVLRDVESVLEVIYQQTHRSLPMDAFWVCLYDEAANRLSYPLVYDGGRRWQEPSTPMTPGMLMTMTIQTGEPVLVNRTPDEIEQQARVQRSAIGHVARVSASFMFAPLVWMGKVMGVISAHSYSLNAYTPEHLELLIGVAHQAAIAIENARLFEAQQHELAERVRAEDEARRQLNELSVLHAIANAAVVAAHVDELLTQAVRIIGERLYPDIIGILLADPATGILRPHPASRGLRPELLYESVPPGIGIIGQVASRGQAWRIPDVRLEPAYIPINPGILSEVCVPLKAGEQVIGVINLESERESGFSEADERLLVTIAGQLASAIEHLRAQAQIRQLNVALEQRVQERTAQLQEANRELESFSYSVSHDLRAPLRGIDGFARILLEDYARHLDADGQRYLLRVRANAQHMGQLIDDLLEFSRLGRQALTLQPVDTVTLVRAVLSELQSDQAQRQIDIVIGALPNCRADRALLKQVWVNLLSNALKYTREREQARIEIGWTGEAYFVRDNGAGFDMRYADKLFGVFQRLHRQDEFEGTGVGLANVKRIIERHGGRIWAEAELDQGATFYFTLAHEREPTRTV